MTRRGTIDALAARLTGLYDAREARSIALAAVAELSGLSPSALLTDPEAELAEARKLATYAKNKLCQDLSEFCDFGRHALLDKDDLAALEIVLRSTLDQVQAARKSAQDRPSNPDSLPVADVFAATGNNSSFNIPSL